MPSPDPAELWRFLPWGYALTVLLELPVLWFALAPRHPPLRRLFAACWLTACTYPVVVLVLPLTIEPIWGRTAYVVGAELFAPTAECLLFLFAFRPSPGSHDVQRDDSSRNGDGRATSTDRSHDRSANLRDAASILAANLVSFLVGGWLTDALG